jgi:hypothetical protein
MSSALDLIQTVEANGGQFRVDGGWLVITPEYAATSIVDELRRHKGEIIRLLETRQSISAHDPEEWRAPFVAWLNSRCLNRPRWFSGVSCLHDDLCEWEISRNGVPPDRPTFIRMLEECGYLVGKICRTELVSGLALATDVNSYELAGEMI